LIAVSTPAVPGSLDQPFYAGIYRSLLAFGGDTFLAGEHKIPDAGLEYIGERD
jgi:hypothetical protein